MFGENNAVVEIMNGHNKCSLLDYYCDDQLAHYYLDLNMKTQDRHPNCSKEFQKALNLYHFIHVQMRSNLDQSHHIALQIFRRDYHEPDWLCRGVDIFLDE
jgi:hypothetical protein